MAKWTSKSWRDILDGRFDNASTNRTRGARGRLAREVVSALLDDPVSVVGRDPASQTKNAWVKDSDGRASEAS